MGIFSPKSPAAIFASGEQSDVPLMAGWNKDEGFNFTLLPGETAKRSYAGLVRGSSAAGRKMRCLLSRGIARNRGGVGAGMGGDLTIIHSTWAWIEAQKAAGKAEIFRFRFDRAPLTPPGWFGERDSR